MEDKLLTRAEAQQILRLSTSSMFNLIRTREIPSLKIGKSYRIKLTDLQKYLENQKMRGKST